MEHAPCITVLAFGVVAEKMQTDKLILQNVSSIVELILELNKLYPQLHGMTYRIAVDRKITCGDTQLSTNTEIALLPPFSGG